MNTIVIAKNPYEQVISSMREEISTAQSSLDYWKVKLSQDSANEKKYITVMNRANKYIFVMNRELDFILNQDSVLRKERIKDKYKFLEITHVNINSIDKIEKMFDVGIGKAYGYGIEIKMLNLLLNSFIRKNIHILKNINIDFKWIDREPLIDIIKQIKKDKIKNNITDVWNPNWNNYDVSNPYWNISDEPNWGTEFWSPKWEIIINRLIMPHLKIFKNNVLNVWNKLWRELIFKNTSDEIYSIILSYLFPSDYIL